MLLLLLDLCISHPISKCFHDRKFMCKRSPPHHTPVLSSHSPLGEFLRIQPSFTLYGCVLDGEFYIDGVVAFPLAPLQSACPPGQISWGPTWGTIEIHGAPLLVSALSREAILFESRINTETGKGRGRAASSTCGTRSRAQTTLCSRWRASTRQVCMRASCSARGRGGYTREDPQKINARRAAACNQQQQQQTAIACSCGPLSMAVAA